MMAINLNTLKKLAKSFFTFFGYLFSFFIHTINELYVFYVNKSRAHNEYVDFSFSTHVEYKEISFFPVITSRWDMWRLSAYEKYPVDEIYNDIDSYGQEEPINYYELGANIGYSVLAVAKLLEMKGNTGSIYALSVSQPISASLQEILNLINLAIRPRSFVLWAGKTH